MRWPGRGLPVRGRSGSGGGACWLWPGQARADTDELASSPRSPSVSHEDLWSSLGLLRVRASELRTPDFKSPGKYGWLECGTGAGGAPGLACAGLDLAGARPGSVGGPGLGDGLCTCCGGGWWRGSGPLLSASGWGRQLERTGKAGDSHARVACGSNGPLFPRTRLPRVQGERCHVRRGEGASAGCGGWVSGCLRGAGGPGAPACREQASCWWSPGVRPASQSRMCSRVCRLTRASGLWLAVPVVKMNA